MCVAATTTEFRKTREGHLSAEWRGRRRLTESALKAAPESVALNPWFAGPLPEEPRYATELAEPLRRLLLDPARSIGRDDIELVGITGIPRHPVVQQTTNGI